jgi:predicted GH43/DUF377 family glycosyl hydrolase
VKVNRTGIVLSPDPSRVLIRPFWMMSETRAMKVIARVMGMTESEVREEYETVLAEFSERHREIEEYFLARYEAVRRLMITDEQPSDARRKLIGSYFTSEYSLECAALFNPSIVPHPNQSGLEEGDLRFAMSLRATGEGHISSITFREGVFRADGSFDMEPAGHYVTAPDKVADPYYDKRMFMVKLRELELLTDFAERVVEPLGDTFSLQDLMSSVKYHRREFRQDGVRADAIADGILLLAEANYEIQFEPHEMLSERAIFPSNQTDRNGIEDARFTLLTEDDGRQRYYATFTAFDGRVTLPQLLETEDFLHFKVNTLNGPAVQSKDMALFPRRIGGYYAMLSRQDNENIHLMFSDNVHFWYESEPIVRPTYPWEYVQLGTCGPPIETEAGWLVLTHGVGAVRKYCIGAILLDRNDPARVLGRLREPLIEPYGNERQGYVPNVVYTCGALKHNGSLVIPYAMSDHASAIATLDLGELLDTLTTA